MSEEFLIRKAVAPAAFSGRPRSGGSAAAGRHAVRFRSGRCRDGDAGNPAFRRANPVIGLGTANEFQVRPEADARANLKKVVDDLLAQGCKLIDTASSYGSAESVLGELLSDQDRSKVFLATKIENGSKQEGSVEFRRSLQRLRYQQVDLLQLHNVRDRRQDLPRSATGRRRGFAAMSGSPRPSRTTMTRPKRCCAGKSRTSFRSIIRWPTGTRKAAAAGGTRRRRGGPDRIAVRAQLGVLSGSRQERAGMGP